MLKQVLPAAASEESVLGEIENLILTHITGGQAEAALQLLSTDWNRIVNLINAGQAETIAPVIQSDPGLVAQLRQQRADIYQMLFPLPELPAMIADLEQTGPETLETIIKGKMESAGTVLAALRRFPCLASVGYEDQINAALAKLHIPEGEDSAAFDAHKIGGALDELDSIMNRILDHLVKEGYIVELVSAQSDQDSREFARLVEEEVEVVVSIPAKDMPLEKRRLGGLSLVDGVNDQNPWVTKLKGKVEKLDLDIDLKLFTQIHGQWVHPQLVAILENDLQIEARIIEVEEAYAALQGAKEELASVDATKEAERHTQLSTALVLAETKYEKLRDELKADWDNALKVRREELYHCDQVLRMNGRFFAMSTSAVQEGEDQVRGFLFNQGRNPKGVPTPGHGELIAPTRMRKMLSAMEDAVALLLEFTGQTRSHIDHILRDRTAFGSAATDSDS